MACALALAVPLTAGAATAEYRGSFDPGGKLSFELEKRRDGKKIIDYSFRRFPVDCDGGPATTRGNLSFAVAVRNNKFETVAQSPYSELRLTGELKPGGKAFGTLKVSGPEVKLEGGGRDNCASPRTNWSASK